MVVIGEPPFQIEIPDDYGQGQKQINVDKENMKKQIKEKVFAKITDMTKAKTKTEK